MHENTVLRQWLTLGLPRQEVAEPQHGAVAWLEGTRPTSDWDCFQPLHSVRVFSVTRIYAFELRPLARFYIMHSTYALRICGASN